MIIILEGCDGSGKSTLANKLVHGLKGSYVHFSKPKGPAADEYNRFLDSINKRRTYIVDRFLLGEMVYGPLFRKKSSISMVEFNKIENRLEDLNAFCIMVDPGVKETIKNIETRGDDHVKPADIKKIRNKYYDVINISNLQWMPYDYRVSTSIDVIKVIKQINKEF